MGLARSLNRELPTAIVWGVGSGGQRRQVVRMRGSMVVANVSNSTMPTLLQGKSGRPLRRRVSCTRQTSMKKRRRWRSSDHSVRCELMTVQRRRPNAFSKAGRPPPGSMLNVAIMRRASVAANRPDAVIGVTSTNRTRSFQVGVSSGHSQLAGATLQEMIVFNHCWLVSVPHRKCVPHRMYTAPRLLVEPQGKSPP